jgi:hypothetical protein
MGSQRIALTRRNPRITRNDAGGGRSPSKAAADCHRNDR